ncbi:MAG: primosomal protein N' [Candidatus Spechtbacterales bacterium]
MYIVSVIPLAKMPHPAPQILDYFCFDKIEVGGVVEVPIGSRKTLGIVAACSPVSHKKQQIKISAIRLRRVEKIITKSPAVPYHYVKLALWTANYFYSPLGLIMRSFLPQIFTRPTKKFIGELASADTPGSGSRNQGIISRKIKSKKPTLYYSNNNAKSRITFYESAIRKAIYDKKSVLFLVPELYKIDYFKKGIPGLKNAVAAHSGLTNLSQYKIWQQAKSQDVKCLIGTRSSLAIPLSNLGLIIIDEEESPFYKSFDQQPYINAKTIALKLAELTDAEVILGTNLPSIESLWNVKNGQYKQRGIKRGPCNLRFQVIDMRNELKAGNYSIFSKELQAQLTHVIKNEQQAILFINRKGLNTGLVCRDCGHVIKCQNCDVPMVYHQNYKLICHHCGQRQEPPDVCPKCESYRIKFVGAGTQRVEQELVKFLRETKTSEETCKIARLDLNTAPTFSQQREIIDAFSLKKISILIGTQAMLHEALLPRAELTAIITIDPMLSLPDFRIREQVIRILYKLGTSSLRHLILQTYVMDNYIIQSIEDSALKTKSFHVDVFNALLMSEIEQREELSLPPFSQIINLSYAHENPKKAEGEATILKNKLITQATNYKLSDVDYQILGPAPAFIPRVNDRYIWQIMIKSKIADIKLRNKLLRVVPSEWKIDVDPIAML